MVIAFYLPQFHRIPENDFWWGDGFTEWRHLERWRPLYDGHQIRRPHPDLGYYDLTHFDTRAKQAQIANKYGVGFCYYHYWFNDKVLLDKPLQLMLQDGQPDVPFCMSWANEHWSRRWTGEWKDILQWQTYGKQDEWKRHIDYLMPFFKHPNYIKVNNKPIFLIYHFFEVDPLDRLNFYRDECVKNGFDGIHLVNTYFCGNFEEFPMHLGLAEAVADFWPIRATSRWPVKIGKVDANDSAYLYRQIAQSPQINTRHYLGTFSGFDNTPRKGAGGLVYYGTTSQMFGESLRASLARSTDGIVFVNAWNEWGEQAILEPDDINGYAYLEEVRKATSGALKKDSVGV
jgi:hypothetical protein